MLRRSGAKENRKKRTGVFVESQVCVLPLLSIRWRREGYWGVWENSWGRKGLGYHLTSKGKQARGAREGGLKGIRKKFRLADG